MRVVAGWLLTVAVAVTPWPGVAAPSDLAERQSDAERQQAQLRDRIDALQQSLEERESARGEAADALKASESAISRINRRLHDLAADNDRAEAELASLEKQITDQQQTLQRRRSELSGQLRTQYTSGLSPWTALLSGDDPQQLGRNLGYLGYVSRERANAVQALRQEVDRLAELQGHADARRAEIQRTVDETTRQRTELVKQQSERATLLAQLEGQIAAQRAEASKLGRDDSRLSTLIVDLEKAINEQAEAARRAEAARQRAEAVRRAQEARQAEAARIEAETQRQVAAQRAAEAEKAAQAAKTEQDKAAAQARREAAARDAALAREQVEAARERQRAAEARERSAVALGDFSALRPANPGDQRVRQPRPAASPAPTTQAEPPPAQAEASPAQAAASPPPPTRRAAPPAPSTANGLRHGLPAPVRGTVQGRFGVSRPDGGVWRGIVLRTDAGTPVKAVAPGTVVYANWLRGFGNLIIVDHGKQYMTVYAYNQSLLKQVGDTIAAGEAVATVGSTGGQVESGLYFEIRYRGTPVDPAQWLAL